MKEVLIIAAEASSTTYAQRLLEYWKVHNKDIHAFGVGSNDMEKIGFERFGRAEDMAVVGAVEVISHYKEIKQIFNKIVEQAAIRKPKVAIVMDYPEFNLRLAKKLHELNIPVIYYISPQIWAWRSGRVHDIKKYCKRVYLLFPFESEFYNAHQVATKFIGHPLLDEMNDDLFSSEKRILKRQQCGFKNTDIVLGLMPGSRKLEVKQNFPTQLEAAKILAKKYSQIKILIMVAPTFEREDLLPYLDGFRLPYVLLKTEPFHMIQLTDVVLAASGTATLMVGLLHKPMVIMYKMKWLTGILAKMISNVKFFGIVNLIMDKEVVPERFQKDANPEHLAELLEKYIIEDDYRDKVVKDLKQIQSYLGNKGATQRVAEDLQEFLV